MESVAVFLVGVAIVWIVFWAIRNDKSPRIADQRGLFRMRVPGEAETEPEPRRRAGPPARGRPSRN